MKKKWFNDGGPYRSLFKWLRVMKLTLFFLLAAFMHVSASVYSQQTKISISLQNVLVKDVLKLVEDQSEFFFLYKNENIDVNRTVSVDVKKKSVEYLLDQLFKGTTVSYEVVDKQIVLVDKRESNPFTQGQSQQQKRISGKVSDSSGSPLPGVTVLVKGTTNGIITDSNGNFVLPNVPENAILVFSFVGMKSQEVKVGNQTAIRVTLEEETVGIEEVVAVGYGTQKKINLTGSLASISQEKIKSIPTANVVTGLAGKLPGLRVTERTSEPGAYNTSYDIRGFGNPLIIVDGIERTDFNKFDPNEIENITILKDASAAVYGVKAANGVILVTTKKGDIGKPIISYTTNYSFQKILDYPEVDNAYQFAVLTTENEIYQGKAPSSTTFSPDDIQKFKDGTYPSTDWLSVAQNKYGYLNHQNITISGGSERVRYFNSLGYEDEMGIYKSRDLNYKKYVVRTSVTGQITDNLTANLNIDGIMENKNAPSNDGLGVFHFTIMNKPTFPVYANNTPPYLQDFGYAFHPLAVSTASIGGYNKTITKTFQGNFTLDYKFNVSSI
jgi:TonB-linked SusC/RagA family outer membrane protein